MADVVTPEKRSQMMAGIRGRNTKPELLIRRGLHRLGYRFRLHDSRLPGTPDLVLPKYKAAIFVQGCFWHRHECALFKWPSSRPDFWKEKIAGNAQRDQKAIQVLLESGWRVAQIWECALKGANRRKLDDILNACEIWLFSPEATLTISAEEIVMDTLATDLSSRNVPCR